MGLEEEVGGVSRYHTAAVAVRIIRMMYVSTYCSAGTYDTIIYQYLYGILVPKSRLRPTLQGTNHFCVGPGLVYWHLARKGSFFSGTQFS